MSYKVVPHLDHADCLEVVTYREKRSPEKPIDSITVECTTCGAILEELYNASEDNTPPLDDDPEMEALWARVEARFKDGDLDDEVHELVSQQASAINNGGLREQFEYLYREAGKDWWLELFAAEDAEEK